MEKINILIILLLGLVGVAFVFSPDLIAEYVGGHTWYEAPECIACHENTVSDARKSNFNIGPHQNNTGEMNKSVCIWCHTGVETLSNITKKHAHNVSGSKADCIDCHKTHNYRWQNISNLNESAHERLVNTSAAGGAGIADQRGCITCHTGVNINIKKNVSRTLVIVYNETNNTVKEYQKENWTIINVSVYGPEKRA